MRENVVLQLVGMNGVPEATKDFVLWLYENGYEILTPLEIERIHELEKKIMRG